MDLFNSLWRDLNAAAIVGCILIHKQRYECKITSGGGDCLLIGRGGFCSDNLLQPMIRRLHR